MTPQVWYNIVLVIAILVAVMFTLIVLLMGKGDAMSGGSGIRTTFKGKAGFDDFISRLTIGLGALFMVLMLVLDMIGNRLS